MLILNLATDRIYGREIQIYVAIGIAINNHVFPEQKQLHRKVLPVQVAEGTEGSGGTTPLIFNLGNIWIGVVNFTYRQFYHRERTRVHIADKDERTQGHSERFEKDKYLLTPPPFNIFGQRNKPQGSTSYIYIYIYTHTHTLHTHNPMHHSPS